MATHIDIESRSEVNLKTEGVYKYATHPSTEILCVCWAIDDGPVQRWDHTQQVPQALHDAMNRDAELWAHNAAFERLMFHFNRQDLPRPHDLQWHCTAALARAYNLPSALGDTAKAINLPYQKDKRGEELIRLMSIPPFKYSADLLAEMVAYCEQDVLVERGIHSVLPEPPWDIWHHYHVNEDINDEGIMVDTEFAAVAAQYAEAEKLLIKRKFATVMSDMGYDHIQTPGSTLYSKVLADDLLAAEKLDQYALVARYDEKEDKTKYSLAKDIVEALLEHPLELPLDHWRALELKQEYSRSSSSKFQKMLDRAGDNDRVRGAYVFLGAAKSGRYSSRGLQMHNMPRDGVEDPLDIMDAAVESGGHSLDLEQLPALIRPTLMPQEGSTFICGDWAGIEARALPWLADPKGRNRRVQQLMQMFRDGEDIYVDEAMNTFGLPASKITKALRQIGKVEVLSLGYGGSVGAFNAMGKNYGVTLPAHEVEQIVQAWRTKNAWAVAFWRLLMDAANEAFNAPGVMFGAGRVHFVREGDVLYCELPSGRRLAYVGIRREDPPEGKEWAGPQLSCIKPSVRPKQHERHWPRERLWGGLLAENVTQAVCADLLMHALSLAVSQLDNVVLGAVVGHTHDEILYEAWTDEGAEVALAEEALTRVMLDSPDWAEGLPLDVETWTGTYYRK